MSAILSVLLSSNMARRAFIAAFIVAAKALAKRTDNSIDDDMVSAIEGALKNGQ